MQIKVIIVFCLIASCFASCDGRYTRGGREAEAQQINNSRLDTFTLNGQILVAIHRNDRFVMLITLAGDTVIPHSDSYLELSFYDINQDGWGDLRVSISSNTPNESGTYFFKPLTKNFTRVSNCDLDFSKVSGSNLFYSYNRAGCGDLTWVSQLFKIESDSAIPVGIIENRQCNGSDDGIFIFRISSHRKIVHESLPTMDFEMDGPNDKFSFIENYWHEHLKEFQ